MTHDRGSGPYRDGKPLTAETLHQDILNTDWPYQDKTGARHAKGINDRPVEDERLVTVRLVFKDDGETFLPGRATRWTDQPADRAHVFVIVDDPRVAGRHVWVKFSDVRAR